MLHLAPSTRPPLYKYSKWAHTEDLIRWGKIRVGTLRDYRNIERHAAGIGDAAEGHKELNEIIGEATGETLSDFSASVMAAAFPGIAGACGGLHCQLGDPPPRREPQLLALLHVPGPQLPSDG
jgi:hypothetical protein